MARFSVGDAVSDAFEVALGQLPLFLRTQGVLLSPTFLLHALLSLFVIAPAAGLLQPGRVENAVAFFDALGGGVWWFFAILILLFLVGAVAGAVGIVVADAFLQGKRPGLGEAWGLAAPRLGGFIGATSALVGLYVLAPLVLLLAVRVLVVLGWIGTWIAVGLLVPVLGLTAFLWFRGAPWLLAPVVTVAAEEYEGSPLAASAQLTTGSAGAILALYLVFVGLKRIAHLLVLLLVGVALYFLNPEGGSWTLVSIAFALVHGVLQLGVNLVLGPVVAAGGTLVGWVLAEKQPAVA